MKYRNPILSGYHPDPSICRAGDDFYLVNSSFEFYPGVPLYHSKNLVNWELAGYCLNSEKQIRLGNCRPSGGIYAPCIRFHDGWFFMTVTNVSWKGNLIIHTKNPMQGWSDPVWVDQGGIDPTLFFDDDGKVYFASTGMSPDGKQCIEMCQIDPFTGEKLTESRIISYGCGGRYPEGPHIYKIWGKYYLMLAEGGTEYGHMETMLRADCPFGPYTPGQTNPILTHSQDTREEIYCTGHADIVEDSKGNWWMVCLAVRPCGEKKNRVLLHNLGRETFLTPLTWSEDHWPKAGHDGLIDLECDADLPGDPQPVDKNFHDDFQSPDFPLEWNYLRDPESENYKRMPEQGYLRLKGTEKTLSDNASPTFIGVRQTGFFTSTTAFVRPETAVSDCRVGLTAYYCTDYHYEIFLTYKGGKWMVCIGKHIHDLCTVAACAELDPVYDPVKSGIYLKISSDKEYYRFFFGTEKNNYMLLGTGRTEGLSTEGTMYMTFTGVYLGIFAERVEADAREFSMNVQD